MRLKTLTKEILNLADVQINGNRPQDIVVYNEKLYSKVLNGGSKALGEAYMDGWFDCEKLDLFFYKILSANIDKKVIGIKNFILPYIKAKFFNLQKSKSYHIGEWHYDIGNELYESMLDKNMQYSCGYFKNTNSLNKAQEQKLDLICKKLELKKGETLLDIGCGFGALLRYAAKKYKVRGLGVTVSKEQAKYANKITKGLDVEIKVMDYRKLDKKFDKIVSVGMFEHVGYKNYKEFMSVASRCLKEDGLFLLHTIGSNKSSKTANDPWLNKYIFPNGKLPSVSQIAKTSEKEFIIEDLHNFGPYYDKTLMAWHKNFNKAWPKLKENYDHRFYRMWNYYLLMCAGSFRARKIQLWQVVFSKRRNKIYESIR